MKIRINGTTIETANIISIGPLEERHFESQIYFTFDVKLKRGEYISPLFKTHIYDGFLCTSYIPPAPQKSKEYWFKTREFLETLPEYKEVKERAQKMRESIELIWAMPRQTIPIQDFNS